MLTVKYEKPNGKSEVFEVLSIIYNGNFGSIGEIGKTPCGGHVEFIRPNAKDNDMAHAYEGLVYVMNDSGKTVAKYDLGGWPMAGLVGAHVGPPVTVSAGL